MAGIKDYSTTASSNTALFPEGMNPANVNNNMRQVQADVRSWYETPQWRDLGHTVTYASTTTFTISSNVTASYIAGQRIRCTDSSTLYGTIVSSSYSAPNTTVTVTLDSGNLSASLSAVAVGIDPTNKAIPAAALSGSFTAGSVGFAALDADFLDDATEVVITASDNILLGDVSDSGNTKRDTVQGILDLVTGTFAGFQVLTSSGTYTPTTGAAYGIAVAIGGGGGSGGADGVNGSAAGAGGGGGGGGAAIAKFTISGTVSYTIGAGGTAGSDTGGNGGNGGTTTLTGIAVATGGAGGTGSGSGGSSRGSAAGGAGGIGTTGDLLLEGGDGGMAKWQYSTGEGQGGEGGGAPYGGGGGRAGVTTVTGTGATLVAGTAGNQYGGGAGGPSNHSSTPGQAGEAGAQGVIYVFEFK